MPTIMAEINYKSLELKFCTFVYEILHKKNLNIFLYVSLINIFCWVDTHWDLLNLSCMQSQVSVIKVH